MSRYRVSVESDERGKLDLLIDAVTPEAALNEADKLLARNYLWTDGEIARAGTYAHDYKG